jgi:hypothetical protein
VIFAVLLVAGVSATAWLGACALRSWREQRAALAYELTPSYRAAALRAIAALAAAGCALTGGSQVVFGQSRAATAPLAAALTSGRPARSGPASRAGVGSDAQLRRPVHPPSARVSAAPRGLLTVGHPAGGELREGTLPGYPGRLLIWLPQQYPHRTHPLQALIVLADPRQLPDILRGLAQAVTDGRANPFVVVAPEPAPAPGAPAPAAAPASAPCSAPCSAPTGLPTVDGARLRSAVAQIFHVEPAARPWGVLGLGQGAPGAVAAELADPGSYAAGVGLGGRYDGLPPALLSAARPGVRLLLADTARDPAGQASAGRLRRALVGVAPGGVRLSDTVRDLDDQSERIRLARLAAGYLAEQMAASGRQ